MRVPARFMTSTPRPPRWRKALAWKSVSSRGSGDALGAEGVDQQHVAARLGLAQPAHAVGVEHAKAGVVRRHAEMPAQRDHVGVDLHHGQLRRQVAVAEVRQRAAAGRSCRSGRAARIEQQEGHHRARVGEHERGQVGDVHHALHAAGLKLAQRTQAAVLEHEGLAVVARDQAGGERGGSLPAARAGTRPGLGGKGLGNSRRLHRIGGGAAGVQGRSWRPARVASLRASPASVPDARLEPADLGVPRGRRSSAATGGTLGVRCPSPASPPGLEAAGMATRLVIAIRPIATSAKFHTKGSEPIRRTSPSPARLAEDQQACGVVVL